MRTGEICSLAASRLPQEVQEEGEPASGLKPPRQGGRRPAAVRHRVRLRGDHQPLPRKRGLVLHRAQLRPARNVRGGGKVPRREQQRPGWGADPSRLRSEGSSMRRREWLVAWRRATASSTRSSWSALTRARTGPSAPTHPVRGAPPPGVKEHQGPSFEGPWLVAGARFVSRYHRPRIRETSRHPS
jgi:hypothetical protein